MGVNKRTKRTKLGAQGPRRSSSRSIIKSQPHCAVYENGFELIRFLGPIHGKRERERPTFPKESTARQSTKSFLPRCSRCDSQPNLAVAADDEDDFYDQSVSLPLTSQRHPFFFPSSRNGTLGHRGVPCIYYEFM